MTPARPPRATIVVAADSQLAAARIEALLRSDPTAHVVTAEPAQVASVASEHAPCIVILSMPLPAVLRALGRLTGARRMPPVIVLTAAPHEAWTTRARRAGVRAVLRHDATAEDLAAAIAATTAGLLALHPEAVAAAPAAVGATVAPSSLTAREIEVLEMISEGMSNRAIARHLKISSHTVKFHVASVLGKLGARSRTEAVTAGIRHGLISL